ncbi:MAG TPA: hypothetical protein VIF57_07600 [Polyangia bacterium]
MSTSRPQDISGDDDLIDRWLDEGDRLSESARASGAGAPARKRRRLAEAVADLRAKAERRRFTVVVGAVAVATVCVLGMRAWSHAVLRSAAVVAEEPRPAPAAAIPAVPAPAAEAAPVAVAAPAPQEPPVAVAAPVPQEPPVAAAGPAGEPQPVATPAPAPRPVAVAPPVPAPRPVAVAPPAPMPVAVATSAPAARPLAAAQPAGEPVPVTAAPKSAAGSPDALSSCRTALRRERTMEALAACDKVVRERPASADALVLLARANLLGGWDGETLRLARRASFLDPTCADAYLLIGSVEQGAGRTSAARTAYESYLQLAPHGPHADELRAILRKL